MKVLFVCLGNICRSPMAEGVFKKHLMDRNLENKVLVDSAGTSGWHIGANPDKRMCETALRNSVQLDHKARQFTVKDFDEFDYIIPMDKNNYVDIIKLSGGREEFFRKVILMREFDSYQEDKNVPDPYYGGLEGFDNVYTMLERCTGSFLDYLIERKEI